MSKKEELAKQYSFNIPSEIYNTLETDADRLLWKSETERAFEAGWDAACSEVGGEKYNCGKILNLRRKAYTKGKEDFLDKACKWLIEHKEAVETEDNGIMGWIPDYFIEDFRRAMEE